MIERASLARLRGKYVEYATLYFDGLLPIVPVVLSYRMTKQLARVETLGGKPSRLVMSAHHIRTHGWAAAQGTLLHELVHILQAVQGKPMNHDAYFREQARRVGIVPAASELIHPLKRCHVK